MPGTRLFRGCVATFCLALALTGVARADDPPPQPDPLDWPHWRGPEMNGISREKDIVGTWSPEGENVLWKNEEIGTRSTPIVSTRR